MERRLYRSHSERMIAGVAGGLGEYLGLDPVFVRLFLVVFAMATGWGVLLYAILWVVMPPAPSGAAWVEPQDGAAAASQSYRRLDARERGLLLGGTLVLLGLVFLAKEFGFWWWIDLRRMWPLVFIAAGVALLIDRARGVR